METHLPTPAPSSTIKELAMAHTHGLLNLNINTLVSGKTVNAMVKELRSIKTDLATREITSKINATETESTNTLTAAPTKALGRAMKNQETKAFSSGLIKISTLAASRRENVLLETALTLPSFRSSTLRLMLLTIPSTLYEVPANDELLKFIL